MPERIDLDQRLAGGRAALLNEIGQPPLARVTARAATVRRRRRAGRAGAALAVVAVALALVRPDSGEPPGPVAEPPPTKAPVFAASGLTLNGIPDPAAALDLPGVVTDVEFADPEHGYAVSSCAPASGPCRPGFARTADGGRSWTIGDLPGPAGDAEIPELVVFGAGRVLLRAGDRAYVSSDHGRGWRPASVANDPVTAAGDGDVLRAGAGTSGCRGGRVEVWTSRAGPHGPLATQPGIDVCSVVTATGRTWWAGGGTAHGRAAVAVTRDGGRTWQRSVFDVAGSARVAALGRHVYALVTDAGQNPVAVFHSTDQGRTFGQSGGAAALRSKVVGQLVPLLDGRLLIAGAGGGWLVSADDGATFERAVGNLPAVGGLARTRAGYVAYDLFGGGWVAFSADGSTWHKLELR